MATIYVHPTALAPQAPKNVLDDLLRRTESMAVISPRNRFAVVLVKLPKFKRHDRRPAR